MAIELRTNANFISEDEVKGINELLREYRDKKALYDDLGKTLDILKEQIKEAGTIGLNQTSDFEFSLIAIAEKETLDTKKIAEKYPTIVEDKEVYKTVKGYVKLDRVTSRK